ncbi:hypothetical protein EJ05DRAFT_209170 [Pseudovirgaria hyperparasitica]|uniref:Malate dehydrogenase n=1 Tax=Pseudovirgaria hyperparasitica TaxID=470096 RepID=A0A6A6VSS9_9PEZI|nr:uncharacterized protein EJ05DRAFT_209170 [Pseudovirgaria hyperparasitica]KAF2753273.1 hypothetical protein EJ05DRAFT_209170 [Pseudovirgaria hyperparasitica]
MLFLGILLAAASLSSIVLAAPAKRDLDSIVLPESTLPAPASGLKLKYIILGVGTQNYTCADGAAGTLATAVGAVATLYDMSSVANDPFSKEKIQCTPPVALGAYTMGQNVLDGYVKVAGYANVIGKHFFDASGVPTFELSGASVSPKPLVKAAKKANVAAPAGAFAGMPPNGAVDWLYLADNGNSVGLTAVYRVETAGGKANSCENKPGAQEVKYATEYWMYG